jgi:hypothetical protein
MCVSRETFAEFTTTSLLAVSYSCQVLGVQVRSNIAVSVPGRSTT